MAWLCVEEKGWSHLEKGIDFEVEGKREKGRVKRTRKNQVKEESVKVGLRREDALQHSKWNVSVNKIAAGWR